MSAKDAAGSGVPSVALKLVLVGPSQTGAKSTLFQRFVSDEFEENLFFSYPRFIEKEVTLDGINFKLELWGLLFLLHDLLLLLLLLFICNACNRYSRRGKAQIFNPIIL